MKVFNIKFKKTIKKFLKRILGKYGLKIVQIKHAYPLVMDVEKVSPILISYLLHNNSILIEAKMDKGRGAPINSFGNKGNHPFAFAVSLAKTLSKEKQYDEIYKILKVYYQKVKPDSAGKIAGSAKKSILHKYPSWSIIMPWNSDEIDTWKTKVEESVYSENINEKSNFGIEKGFSWIGPASKEKAIIEATRLTNILQSIQSKGYIRKNGEDGDIRVDLLINEKNNWIWQTQAGQHRAAVLSGLGFESVPIRVNRIIRRQDVEFWPNVVNRTYSKEDALNVFDMIFNKSYSHVTNSWDSYIGELKKNI